MPYKRQSNSIGAIGPYTPGKRLRSQHNWDKTRPISSMKLSTGLLCVLASIGAASLRADDNVRFDLAGPKISVRVTRGSKTLPIAQVPNLQAGDKLWVKADLPPTQSNH